MNSSSVLQQSMPTGWTKVGSNGLLLPNNLAKNGPLNSNNQQLLSLKDKLDVRSLRTSIMDAYISSVRKTDGVIRYDGEIKVKDFAAQVMESLSYHVHERHFSGLLEKVKELEGSKDPNGERYSDIVVKALSGFDQESLPDLLENNSVNELSIGGLANHISSRYLTLQTSRALRKMYNDNLSGMREGLSNLGDVFKLEPQLYRTKNLPKLGEQELGELYLKSLSVSWEKIDQEPKY